MEIMTDIDPVELTRYVRPIIDHEEGSAGTLADVFPNEHIESLQVEWNVSERVSLLAKIRSYDTETPLASGGGMEHRIQSLPAMGLKQRFTEYDQLRARSRNSPESVQAAAERKALEVGRATVARVQLLRGEALTNARLVINENGYIQNVDYLRRTDFTKTVATPWGTDGADPLRDLEAWLGEYETENGFTPTVMIMSRRVLNIVRDKFAAAGYFGTTPPALVTNENVNQLLTDRGLPTVTVNDRTAAGRRVIPDTHVILTAGGGMVGNTTWGTPLETYESEYSAFNPGEAPGLLVGAYRQLDPAVKWIHSAAIALPVLTNPNTSLSAKVL